jgi:hypothetical protein
MIYISQNVSPKIKMQYIVSVRRFFVNKDFLDSVKNGEYTLFLTAQIETIFMFRELPVASH